MTIINHKDIAAQAFAKAAQDMARIVDVMRDHGHAISVEELFKGLDYLQHTLNVARSSALAAHTLSGATKGAFSFDMTLPVQVDMPAGGDVPVRSSPAAMAARPTRAPKNLAHKAEQRAVGRLVKEAAGDGDGIVFDAPEPPPTLVPMTGEHDASFIDDK